MVGDVAGVGAVTGRTGVVRDLSARPDAVFLDRDGVINPKPDEGRYVTSPDDLVLLPGVAASLRVLREIGCPVFVVTNQRWVASTEGGGEALEAVHRRLLDLLAAEGTTVDGIYVCPHEAGSCDCRKPAPGLVHQARRDHPWLRPDRCVLVGDRESDVAVGVDFGMVTVRITARPVPTAATWCAPDLRTAVSAVLTRWPLGPDDASSPDDRRAPVDRRVPVPRERPR